MNTNERTLTPEGRCPRCGAALPENTPSDHCPKCLLQIGLDAPPALCSDRTVGATESPLRARSLPQPGQDFGGYRIVRLLGKGGMGTVFEAEDRENGRRVALKVLTQTLDSAEARKRFFREGRTAASINHPNSVYVFGTDEIDGTPVIAMELVTGGTLQERVASSEPLRISEAVDCILQVISGLEAAQKTGILHRDIKPSNCFIENDGTVKIGDFGLSLATAVRTDSMLTETGVYLGTPAFSSPEQVRGDELTVRSDIYAVGVTFYNLLTGRMPFEARNMVQLLATVLEKAAESPTRHRREIPRGLAQAVMRCLEKDPLKRYKDYAELRQALLPYASTAPTPATLGRRALAGLVDFAVLGMFASAVNLTAMMLTGGAMVWRKTSLQPVQIAVTFLLMILYYALPEGLRGASLGKWICGLRVTGLDRNVPGVAKALARAGLYVLLPSLPLWIWVGFDPMKFQDPAMIGRILGMGLANYVVLALLFCTIRRRNGFAAIHDLLSKTRVIRKPAHQARPVMTASEAVLPATEALPKIGPYHVLETLEKTDEGEWSIAYDARLLRKVWLHNVPAGTPPVAAQYRALGRVGRLRWITGRRSERENWDAFEGVTGQPLVNLLDKPQPWGLVRYWLLDLATEIAAAEKDGTLPAVLDLDRVWITGDGRAKLLDFRAPGAPASAGPPALSATAFLNEFARAAVGGGEKLCVPLPVHARRFLEKLPALPTVEAVAGALKPLLHSLAVVTRARRAALVAGCLAVPVLMASVGLISIRIMDRWQRSQPAITDMSQLLGQRTAMRMGFWPKSLPKVEDRLFAIYIASHYRGAITNAAIWQSNHANMMVAGENRVFAEKSLEDFRDPTTSEVAEATAALKPYLQTAELKAMQDQLQKAVWFPLVMAGGLLLIFVCLPALIAALAFRGGLVMLICGVAVVRKDGRPASRGRIFWRSLVAWSPVWCGPILLALLIPLQAMATRKDAPKLVVVQSEAVREGSMPETPGTNAPQTAESTTVATNAPATSPARVPAEVTESVSSVMKLSGSLVALLFIGLTAWSLALRNRSLQDLIAGTRLVPR